MINRVILIGRLTKDIELKSTPSGKTTCTFNLAVQRDKDTADFITCVAWEKKAEILSRYTRKGSQIGVEGRIQTRTYDSNGRTVYVTEVVVNDINLLDPKEKSEEQPGYMGEVVKEASKPYINITADDLPF